MNFPEPVIAMAIEPKTKAGSGKDGLRASESAQEDPPSVCGLMKKRHKRLLPGMGELHLEIIVDRMLREFNVEANVGKPQVAYRETISKKAEAEGKYIKQTGGRGQYGHVVIDGRTAEAGKGLEFVNKVVGGAIPREYIPAIEKGVGNAWRPECSQDIRFVM